LEQEFQSLLLNIYSLRENTARLKNKGYRSTVLLKISFICKVWLTRTLSHYDFSIMLLKMNDNIILRNEAR
jgi:hypothetical protein